MLDDRLLSELQSADLETRVAAIERAAALDRETYAERVAALISQFPRDAYFVLERVGRFGDVIIPHLITLAESTEDEQIRLLAVLGLAHFRRDVDCAMLLKAIRTRSPHQRLACRALAWLGHTELLPELLGELRGTSPASGWDRVVSLVEAIESLGGGIPQSERERLIAQGPPLTKKMLMRNKSDNKPNVANSHRAAQSKSRIGQLWRKFLREFQALSAIFKNRGFISRINIEHSKMGIERSSEFNVED